jgi:hypothetical protein
MAAAGRQPPGQLDQQVQIHRALTSGSGWSASHDPADAALLQLRLESTVRQDTDSREREPSFSCATLPIARRGRWRRSAPPVHRRKRFGKRIMMVSLAKRGCRSEESRVIAIDREYRLKSQTPAELANSAGNLARGGNPINLPATASSG